MNHTSLASVNIVVYMCVYVVCKQHTELIAKQTELNFNSLTQRWLSLIASAELLKFFFVL